MIDPAKVDLVLWGLHKHGRPGIASDILASLQRACAEAKLGPHLWANVNAKDVAYVLGRAINGQRLARTVGKVYEPGGTILRPLFAPLDRFDRDQPPPESIRKLSRMGSKRPKVKLHSLVLGNLAIAHPEHREVLADVIYLINNRSGRGA